MFHGLKKNISVHAIIDSGASSSFIHCNFIKEHKIKEIVLPSSIPLYNIDNSGNAAGEIRTMVILETTIREKRKKLPFLVTDIGLEKVILGIDWLRMENPTINWTNADVFVKTKARINAGVTLPNWIGDLALVFSKQNSFRLPTQKAWDHKIDLKPDATLKQSRAYPLSPQETEASKDYLKENLEKGYIQKSKSPILAPMFFVPKKNGSLRPVQDYRKLNATTIKNSYPLPLISELQDKITQFKTFAKINLRWGFNNIRIREGDEYKAAFITNLGLYKPMVMTFGLCNAPATMQTMMDDLLYELSQTGKLVHYINDIIIGGSNKAELRQTTLQVLRKLKENNLFANLDKFEYDVKEVDILGALVSHGQVCISLEKVSAILNWPTPKKVSEVRQFRGLAITTKDSLKILEKSANC
jgi:hypothetical protein